MISVEQYTTLKDRVLLYIQPLLDANRAAEMQGLKPPHSITIHSKPANLPQPVFLDLTVDLYEELVRRDENLVPYLQPDPSHHPKRNQARQNLSTMSESRFSQLLCSIVVEIEKRFPNLLVQEQLCVSVARSGTIKASSSQTVGVGRGGGARRPSGTRLPLKYVLAPLVENGGMPASPGQESSAATANTTTDRSNVAKSPTTPASASSSYNTYFSATADAPRCPEIPLLPVLSPFEEQEYVPPPTSFFEQRRDSALDTTSPKLPLQNPVTTPSTPFNLEPIFESSYKFPPEPSPQLSVIPHTYIDSFHASIHQLQNSIFESAQSTLLSTKSLVRSVRAIVEHAEDEKGAEVVTMCLQKLLVVCKEHAQNWEKSVANVSTLPALMEDLNTCVQSLVSAVCTTTKEELEEPQPQEKQQQQGKEQQQQQQQLSPLPDLQLHNLITHLALTLATHRLQTLPHTKSNECIQTSKIISFYLNLLIKALEACIQTASLSSWESNGLQPLLEGLESDLVVVALGSGAGGSKSSSSSSSPRGTGSRRPSVTDVLDEGVLKGESWKTKLSFALTELRGACDETLHEPINMSHQHTATSKSKEDHYQSTQAALPLAHSHSAAASPHPAKKSFYRRNKSLVHWTVGLVTLGLLASAGIITYFILRAKSQSSKQPSPLSSALINTRLAAQPAAYPPLPSLVFERSTKGLMGNVTTFVDLTRVGRYVLADNGTGPVGADSGASGVHAGLMLGGDSEPKVVFLERWDIHRTHLNLPNGNPAWSSEYNTATNLPRGLAIQTNLFCAGGALLPDGRMMAIGGAENFTEAGGILNGENRLRLLAPTLPSLGPTPQEWWDDATNPLLTLKEKRWYPTIVPLPTGHLLVLGGSLGGVQFTLPENNSATFEFLPPLEAFKTTTKLQFLWDTQPGNLYPFSALLPSGRIAVSASDRMTLLDPRRGYESMGTFQMGWTVSQPFRNMSAPRIRPAGPPGTNGMGAQGASLRDDPEWGGSPFATPRPQPTSGLQKRSLLNKRQDPEPSPTAPTDQQQQQPVVADNGWCMRVSNGVVGSAPCHNNPYFNQNETAASDQVFAFFPLGTRKFDPTTAPTNEERGMEFDTDGLILDTWSRSCLSALANGTLAVSNACDPRNPAQIFKIMPQTLFHPSTSRCLTFTRTESNSTIALSACTASEMQSSNTLTYYTTPLYFEFPKLPGGPFRSYPWTGATALLPLDPNNGYTPYMLVCGGSESRLEDLYVTSAELQAASTCGMINPEDPSGNWTTVGLDMPTPRVLGDMIHLPDGTLLMLNGAQRGMAGWDLGRVPNTRAHIFNPRTRRWTIGDVSTIPRMYHSSATLLPDGRVLVAGSAPNSPTDPFYPATYPTEYRVEYYEPHYFSLPRPTIKALSHERLAYNQSFTVNLASPSSNPNLCAEGGVEFNIVHTGFRTHSTGHGQRLVWLVSSRLTPGPNPMAPGQQQGASPPGSKDGAVWSATAPLRGTNEVGDFGVMTPPVPEVAPPGWYLLFGVCQGSVSEGVWVQIGGDPADFGGYYSL
ncbi:hypothetical protein HDV05_000476 [Chytridiales sp. JEL 0842]|nr:hypothetical protein HDV05_000476 [Chytridiales sp. JEL 0842]